MTQEISRGRNFFDRFPPSTMIVLSLALFIGFGVLWWNRLYTNPERVFDAMLENSLRLNGVSRHVTQVGGGQNLDQIAQASLGATQQGESHTTLTQGEAAGAVVRTETIGTPTHDFVRYTSIDTEQTTESGEP